MCVYTLGASTERAALGLSRNLEDMVEDCMTLRVDIDDKEMQLDDGQEWLLNFFHQSG